MDPTTFKILSGAAGSSNPPAQITSFTGTSNYTQNQFVGGGTLYWSSIDAVSASIDNGIGTVPLSGSIDAPFSSTTKTFILTVENIDGVTNTASVTLTFGGCTKNQAIQGLC